MIAMAAAPIPMMSPHRIPRIGWGLRNASAVLTVVVVVVGVTGCMPISLPSRSSPDGR